MISGGDDAEAGEEERGGGGESGRRGGVITELRGGGVFRAVQWRLLIESTPSFIVYKAHTYQDSNIYIFDQ